MVVRAAFFLLLLPLTVAFNVESSVSYEGNVRGHVRHHQHQQHHQHHDPEQQRYYRHQHIRHHGVPPPSVLTETYQDPNPFGQPQADVVPTTSTEPARSEVTSIPVINTWACALMCASRSEDGCCSYQNNEKRFLEENDGGVNEQSGVCEFRSGNPTRTFDDPAWIASPCVEGYGTARCAEWTAGRCSGPEAAELASEPLPMWDLVWEDHFDDNTCVRDSDGILRPNPNFWSHEIGYKRGREQQWYQPQNAECKDGALVITAKRERPYGQKPAGAPCTVKNYDSRPPNVFLDNATCAQCAPPSYQYYDPCDILQQDDSGWPACDCSETAEYTSSSLVTRGKKEFSHGLFELKAKIDTRPGAWTSWWAIGDFHRIPWPRNGEIDILDAFQRMVKASVIHSDETGLPSGAVQHAAARQVDPEWDAQYHIWQLEWDKEYVVVRLDGNEMFKLDVSVADPLRTTWQNPFTDSEKKFFFILNMAVGGHSGGDAHESDFPVEFKVDYIKAWRKKPMPPLR